MADAKFNTNAILSPAAVNTSAHRLSRPVSSRNVAEQPRAVDSHPTVSVEAKTNAVAPLRNPLLAPNARARRLINDFQIQNNSFDKSLISVTNHNQPITPEESSWFPRFATSVLNIDPSPHALEARIAAATKRLFDLGGVKPRKHLEDLWLGLNSLEKAQFISHLFGDYVGPSLSPEQAFFLFQLFGKQSPLEVALIADVSRTGILLHRIKVGVEKNYIKTSNLNGNVVGHTHPSTAWGEHMLSPLPSAMDIRTISFPCRKVGRGWCSSFILSPYGGCCVVATISEGVEIKIIWATREGLPEDPLLVDKVRPYYRYKLGDGYRVSFEETSFDVILTMLAQRLAV